MYRITNALLLMLLSFPLMAEEKPKWEAGVGLVGLQMPLYLGASQTKNYLLPLPYFIYRGTLLRADRDGIRGFIYDSDKLDLRLSLGASLPVNSEDSDAREGMDDLDLMLEIGPTLQYQLFENDRHLLRADWPIRAAFTVGSEFFHHQGWTSNPRIYYQTSMYDWTVISTAGLVYSDRRYHGYIYNVETDDVTAERHFYQANSGLSSSGFSIQAKRRLGTTTVGASLRYYNLSGVASEDSPLMQRQDYFAVGVFFSWVLGESEARVSH